jgi:hypothetical protein
MKIQRAQERKNEEIREQWREIKRGVGYIMEPHGSRVKLG